MVNGYMVVAVGLGAGRRGGDRGVEDGAEC
jgi:hypothetical protein